MEKQMKKKKRCLVELRNSLILLAAASTHKYVGRFNKSSSAVKHITHKKGGHEREQIKDITFLTPSFSS